MPHHIDFSILHKIGSLSEEGLMIYRFSDACVMYANAAATELLGVSSQTPCDSIEVFFERILPEDKRYVRNCYTNVVNRSVARDVEFRLRNDTGQELHICCTALPVSEEHMIINVRDISKAKQHENYLVEFGAKKNMLLDTLVHHLSGALNLMQHLTAEAGRSLGNSYSGDIETYLSLLNNNAKHCVDIINNLMLNEHHASPKVHVKHSRVDLVEKINVIYEELKQTYSTRNFVFKTAVSFLYLHTDEVKLLQVINNLISNAIKFSADDQVVTIGIEEQNDHVLIYVKDQGIGIPEEIKPFIFERKGIAGRTGLNGEQSVGLGLSICKKLVNLMGGELSFESKEGAGSVFYMRLPWKEGTL